MGTRSEALAGRFESTVRDAVTTVQRLSDADWKKVTEAEQWPVGESEHRHVLLLHSSEPVRSLYVSAC